MKPRPWVQVPILQILEESATGIRVLTRSGRKPWLPKSEIEYIWGAVLVPEWLAKKLAKQNHPTHSERA